MDPEDTNMTTTLLKDMGHLTKFDGTNFTRTCPHWNVASEGLSPAAHSVAATTNRGVRLQESKNVQSFVGICSYYSCSSKELHERLRRHGEVRGRDLEERLRRRVHE